MKHFFDNVAVLLVVLCLVGSVCAAGEPSAWSTDEGSRAVATGMVSEVLQQDYQKPITRGEFCSLLVGMIRAYDASLFQEMTDASTVAPTFLDTDDNAVRLCAASGIVQGDGKGHFLPDDFITRQQAAKMLYLAANRIMRIPSSIETPDSIEPQDMPHAWEDGQQMRAWARSGVMWCYRAGIMQGIGANSFGFNQNYTREQAILTVLRLYDAQTQPDALKLPAVDYYPICSYEDSRVEYWIDSAMQQYPCDELGHIADTAAQYSFVYDNVGVGVSYGHIINRTGKMQFADLYGANGYFRQARFSGNRILVELQYSTVAVGADGKPLYYFVIDTLTGKIEERPDYEAFLAAPQSENAAIIKQVSTGRYVLTDSQNNELSKIYQNGLISAGNNLYLGWVADYPIKYDILFCDGRTNAKLLRTETFRYNTELRALGNGTYAVQNTDTRITIFDSFGETVAIVNLPEAAMLGKAHNGIWNAFGANNFHSYYYTANGTALVLQSNVN